MPEKISPKLKINPETNQVNWDGVWHPIEFVGTYPSEGYRDKPYVFLDEMGEKANGVVIEIEPNSAAKVLKVLDSEVSFTDYAIRGSGWFLGISPQGNLISQEVGPHLKENNPAIESGAGWIICWISGNEGLEILDVTVPPFKLEMEEEIERYSNQLPQSFWKQFDELITA